MANQRWRAEPSELRRLALPLATLAVVGFSVVLACQTAWLSSELRHDFAEHNKLGERGRLVLLLSLAAGLALPALAGLALFLKKPLEASKTLERFATLSAPLALLFIVPGLFLSQFAQDKPLYYLIVLAAFGLGLDALLAASFSLPASAAPGRVARAFRALASAMPRVSVPRGVPALLVLLAATGYALSLGHSAVAHQRLIQTTTSDIGIADNVLSNLLHGRYFRAPAQFGTAIGNYLSVHAEYGSFLFLPFYARRPGAETLLWSQAGVAALAALPLYFAAARKLGRGVAVWVSAAYLSFAPLHGSLLVGFSWLPAVTLFAFTLYYALETDKRWLAIASLVALLSISEAGPLNALGLGLMLVVSRKNVRFGLAAVLVGVLLVIFNLALSVRGPGALENPPLLTALSAFWKNPVFLVWDLARFSKLAAMLQALAPLALLPLLDFACWPLLLPGLLYTSAGGAFWPAAPQGFASAAVWVPGCFIGLLVVLEKRSLRGPGRAALGAVLVALSFTLLSHSYDFGALLRTDGFGGFQPDVVRMRPQGQARFDALSKVLARIPASASVAATTFLVPHVSGRPDVFDLTRPYGRPDFILLSSRESSYVRASLADSFASHQYRLVLATFDEFYLFSRGAETPETTAALTRLSLTSR